MVEVDLGVLVAAVVGLVGLIFMMFKKPAEPEKVFSHTYLVAAQ